MNRMIHILAAAIAPALVVGAAPALAQMADEHGGYPASVTAFHDVMAADWHTEAGAARIAATCENVPGYRTLAGAVVVDTPPHDVSDAAWRDATNALADAVETLAAACASERQETFEADFSALHDRFHALIALEPGE